MKLVGTKKYVFLIDEEAEVNDGDIRWEEKSQDWYKTTKSDFENQDCKWYKVIAYYPLTIEKITTDEFNKLLKDY